MDEVTRQNSALVEENAATSKSLEQQAEKMDRLVAFFRVGDDGQGEATPARGAAAAGPGHGKKRERADQLRVVSVAG